MTEDRPTGALARCYTTERLDIEYSPAKWQIDRAETLHRHHVLGKIAIETCRRVLDLRYGPGPLQTLDIFPSATGSGPVCVMLHGGFWRISDKSSLHFIAATLSRKGMTCVIPNFDLCPAITIEDMVGQICDALRWILESPSIPGGSADGLILFGHATGAHLAAAALMNTCPRPDRPWLSRIRGCLLVSGLYDLRRIPELEVNSVLRLDSGMAQRMSPALVGLATRAPMVIASAQDETYEFRCQSADFAHIVLSHDIPTDHLVVPHVGHFTVLNDFGNGVGPCADALLSLARVAR